MFDKYLNNEPTLEDIKKKEFIEQKSREFKINIRETFNSEIGRRLLEDLKLRFIDRDIYLKGNTHEDTAYRQGQASVIKMIFKEINNG